MRFASLGSGSRGNATLVESGSTCVMIDCGFSLRETSRRLARLGKVPEDLSAIIVTHEHSDHIQGVAPLARKYRLPVWATHGTARAGNLGDIPGINRFDSHSPFVLGDLEISPFPVPHDAAEPSQLTLFDGDRRLGLLTDTGSATAHIVEMLSGCDALLLEANHEPELLANGSYPWSVKQRVGGPYGHLSNPQAAALLASLDTSKLRTLVAMHLSERHNQPDLVREQLAHPLACDPQGVICAHQESGLPWHIL